MIICLFDVVGNHIFKWQHPIHIHIAGSCNQILFVCIFCRQLIAYQMTTVVKIFSIHIVKFYCLPPGRFHLSNLSSFPGRHQICPNVGRGNAASSQLIQITVAFIRLICQLIFGKIRFIIVNHYIRCSAVCRNIIQCSAHRILAATCCRFIFSATRLPFNYCCLTVSI